MYKKLIIFGVGDMAELAYYYFTNDSDYEVSAFTADAGYVEEDHLFGLPMVKYHELENSFPPSEYDIFIALSYSKLNDLRKNRYLDAKERGYTLASYISSKATILNDGAIGDNCFILEDNTIQPFVKIGNNVTLWSGNHIGHHSTISDHAFLASHVVVSGGVEIGEQSFIGVNATLRDHIKVGRKCVIGAGVLLLSSAGDDSLFIGSATEKSKRSTAQLRRI